MMKRYKTFSECGVKKLEEYNKLARATEGMETMPSVVVVIDELADLMLVAAKEVEESICRVAQMGRAAGVHLVIATQRPSADVITGLMKANIPSRIAFAVASSLESRIILDTTGAGEAGGQGRYALRSSGGRKTHPCRGCFISPEEIEQVVSFVKQTGEAQYDDDVIAKIEASIQEKDKGSARGGSASADSGDEEGRRAAARSGGSDFGDGTGVCLHAAAAAETGIFPGRPAGGPDGRAGDRWAFRGLQAPSAAHHPGPVAGDADGRQCRVRCRCARGAAIPGG